jgi:hypothetical protein
LLAIGLATLVLTSVGVHDAYCYLQFNLSPLCQRADGSLWRDPSNGCYSHEDPFCRYEACPDSTMLREDWRHSCGWVFSRTEVGPTGPPPYFEGPSPGSGNPGRLS